MHVRGLSLSIASSDVIRWRQVRGRLGGLLLGAAGACLLEHDVQSSAAVRRVSSIVRTENSPLCLEARPEELLGIVEPARLLKRIPSVPSSSEVCRDARGPGLCRDDRIALANPFFGLVDPAEFVEHETEVVRVRNCCRIFGAADLA